METLILWTLLLIVLFAKNTVARETNGLSIRLTISLIVLLILLKGYHIRFAAVDSLSQDEYEISFCTNEFTSAREAYNWVCDTVGVYRPSQIEYGRLNITGIVLSKRKLLRLVNEGYVSGWDDPRLFTLQGLKRRGFTPESINNFCDKIGVTNSLTTIEMDLLDSCVRNHLYTISPKVSAVIRPLKVIITNYPGEHNKVIYIDSDDFKNVDDPNFWRLTPSREVGLKNFYHITFTKIIDDGIEVTCDPDNKRKVKSHIQWVSESSYVKAEVRLYSNLFKSKNPDANGFLKDINPNSLEIIRNAFVDKSVIGAKPFDHFQFERVGYFCVDEDSTPERLVFNKTISLKGSSV